MPKIVAQIPDDIYRNIDEEIKLGVFSDASEAVVSALKKAYARKSRTFLRWLMKKEGVTEAGLLKELGGRGGRP
jgi:Arc/MetJ-type ribon-helix-helix transcriptional regulator